MLQPADAPAAAFQVLSPLTPERFASEYAGRVHRFAAMVMRNGQDSEDLAQEALLKAIRGLAKFDQRGNVEAWMWRIVINTARDSGRASVRQTALRDRLHARSRAEFAVDPVELTVFNRLRDQDLLDAVRRLPVKPRTIIALRFGAQLSNLEIGEQLRMRPRAVSMALHRALQRLHSVLEAQS
ncbi:MAG: sigma-70 family RNA polymerase sigma factor [Candidatus Dormibacteraeota bacterium]|uniref:Sigma-70 family RNA polymerase sigma factor n=1 Tax=Candidatus Amunia macphersoniae TaxID=3127014 RepID=A0A934KQH2_9BACT|nr:sigma-70 family RNA polymerase sigma factor [Candidatus Dormibacteraeota bacterium]